MFVWAWADRSGALFPGLQVELDFLPGSIPLMVDVNRTNGSAGRRRLGGSQASLDRHASLVSTSSLKRARFGVLYIHSLRSRMTLVEWRRACNVRTYVFCWKLVGKQNSR